MQVAGRGQAGVETGETLAGGPRRQEREHPLLAIDGNVDARGQDPAIVLDPRDEFLDLLA